ncbi:MAG: thiamine-phosphate diphosphorylase [Nitrospirae bacterium RBG_13_43_8]|nr:MAG: thiamine-phosphate diphosphorylase [Nitrospirae bacterium RBG_13_43_8]
MMYLGGLCFITDRKVSGLSYEDMTHKVLLKGVRWIQFRDKKRSRREIYQNAIRLRRLTKDYDAVFVVNDFPDIALCCGADGVHLGQDDLPLKEARKIMGRDRIIGISTHSLEQAAEAERDGADYIGVGPVFPTLTKDAGRPKGIAMLREIRKQVNIPVVAIGGISLENISSVLQTRVDAVAVASAILRGDIEKNTERFMDHLRDKPS